MNTANPDEGGTKVRTDMLHMLEGRWSALPGDKEANEYGERGQR